MKLDIIPMFIWLYLDVKRTSFVLAQRFVTWRSWWWVPWWYFAAVQIYSTLSSKQVCHWHVRASPNTDPQPPTPQRVRAELTCAKVKRKKKKTLTLGLLCANNRHFLIIPTPSCPKVTSWFHQSKTCWLAKLGASSIAILFCRAVWKLHENTKRMKGSGLEICFWS